MNSESPSGLSRIGQIAINVQDVNRAVEFYRDRLGVKLLFMAGTMAFFDCGGIRLMLSRAEKPEFDHPSSIIYFNVPKVSEMHQLLSSRGVSFESQPHVVARLGNNDLWMAFFRDSENNLLAIMSEEARPAAS
jgi:methylmalonyl-CoA/ethylmalonyl-CoA epimerase